MGAIQLAYSVTGDSLCKFSPFMLSNVFENLHAFSDAKTEKFQLEALNEIFVFQISWICNSCICSCGS